ncbi:hypothetical protein FRC03_007448 [Tulasnella sp. 419]|nr:hypothetical protein FRC02_011851 [Tulasnella sp. 418]KAG8959818.1 hypothetical protein FRC03_007448 [Tulasnella sp. 419]
MKAFSALAFVAAAIVPQVAAHYRWTALIVDGVTTADFNYVRPYTSYNSPVTDVKSKDFTCNAGSTPAPGIADVKAGSKLGFKLDQPIYHPGVLNVYIGKVPSGQTAATWDGSGTNWFRVSQLSAVTNGGTSITFPTDNIPSYTFTVPSSLPSGQYLVRIEHIALHSASSFAGAQFYIACGQINVTGGGSGSPSPLVAIPGVYTGNEPGILINIYWPIPPTYTQPGPAIWP